MKIMRLTAGLFFFLAHIASPLCAEVFVQATTAPWWHERSLVTVSDIEGHSRFSVVDWDKDGDDDLIAGNTEGTITAYINDGTGTFTENRSFGAIDTGSFSAPVAVDWNADGHFDLIIGALDGTLRYYNNDGTDHFIETTDFGSIDVGKYSRPAVIDWDGDGDLDLIVGNQEGTLAYFALDSEGHFAPPDDVGATDVGSMSAPFPYDGDGDGDSDLIVGNGAGTITYFQNKGKGIFLEEAQYGGIFLEGSATDPSVVDWNKDGSDDLLVGSRLINELSDFLAEVYLFQGDGTGGFTRVDTTEYFDEGYYSTPCVIDWEADGDLDVIAGERFGTLNLYRNDGADTFAVIRHFGAIDVGNHSAPFAVDWDKDGDIDLILGDQLGKVHYFENNGADFFTSTDKFNAIDETTQSVPFAVDWDGDGDTDLFVGSWFCTAYYENDGADHFTTDGTCFVDMGCPAEAPQIVDWDDDGDENFIIGINDGTLEYHSRHKGETIFYRQEATFTIDVGWSAAPVAVDWNRDGAKDLVVGGADGRLRLFLKDSDHDGSVGIDDCNSADAHVYVGAPEICDGDDNDCDGAIDENVTGLWFADADGDGYGDAAVPTATCDQPNKSTVNKEDCDDTDASIQPGGVEVCGDGIDQDCDGSDLACPTKSPAPDPNPNASPISDSNSGGGCSLIPTVRR